MSTNRSEGLKKAWITRRKNGNADPWNKGKKGVQVAWNKGLTKEDHKSISNMGFRKGHKDFTSKEARLQASKKRRGENHHNWKGGITPIVMKIRNCLEYRQWRSDIFTRDDFTCQECYVRGVVLNAHHIKKFCEIMEENNIQSFEEALECEELWNLNNGVTLCLGCHNLTKRVQYTA